MAKIVRMRGTICWKAGQADRGGSGDHGVDEEEKDKKIKI